MAKATIQALTPLHIGSGNSYQGNFDYIWFQQEQAVAVLDEERVLRVLGKDNLSQWISCIDNKEPLLRLLQQRKSNLQSADVSKRLIPVLPNGLQDGKEIREQVHSGNGDPIVPGSSLKGAFKTVIWAHLMHQHPNLAKERNYLGVSKFNRKSNREEFEFEDSKLQRQFFGKDPNHDIFRLFLAGDAHFQSTACCKTEVINLGYDDWKIKDQITQYVEVIPTGQSASMELNFGTSMHARLERRLNEYFNNKNKDLLQAETLFKLANEHSLRLIEADIDYWEQDQGGPTVLGTYLEDINSLLAQVKACHSNECIIRMGWGTGNRTMTGSWYGLLDDDYYYDLIKSMRPRHDENIVFPKTMRLVAGGTPLGYVKLTL